MTTTILIVDDQPLTAQLLTRMLTGAGFRVRTARDGVTALVALAAELPDLLLSDIEMPGLDGIALAQHPAVRQGQVPVVLMSAAEPPANLPPEVPFLRKPFTVQHLRAVLETDNHIRLDWRNAFAASCDSDEAFTRMHTATLRSFATRLPGSEFMASDPKTCRYFLRRIRRELSRREGRSPCSETPHRCAT